MKKEKKMVIMKKEIKNHKSQKASITLKSIMSQ